MNRILAFCMLVWLGGFGAAAVTAGAPAAVAIGTVGLLCTLVGIAARIGSQDAPTRRRRPTVGSGG